LLKSQVEYWKAKLVDVPELLHIPLDFSRPPNIDQPLSRKTIQIHPDLWKKVKELVKKENASVFRVGVSAFLILMHRISGDNKVCVGAPMDLRKSRHLPNIMGPMNNIFIITSEFLPEATYREFLDKTSKTAVEAIKNSSLPFDNILKVVCPKRTSGVAPLFQTMFDLGIKIGSVGQHKINLSPESADPGNYGMDLTGRIVEMDSGTDLIFSYNPSLFEETTIDRLLQEYLTLLNAIVENPLQKIDHLNIISSGEQEKLIESFCGKREDYDSCNGVQEYFEKQVDATPDHVALECNGLSMTYRQLESKSNQLAYWLREKGIHRDTLVGLLMERSFEMFIAVLGVLKAGGAYVPLDPEYPSDRLKFLMEDIEAPVILTQGHLLEKVPED
jgi:non-ribosomal peptide synthetase component F